MWVEQWPLPEEKHTALQQLVQEQLDQGRLEPSNSPWNTPVFVVKKKSGKWQLLQDLRKVNEVMESMGVLQPRIPSPTMLPTEWNTSVTDLKDCFFTIPLHQDDRCKFAFTISIFNNSAPAQQYQWTVLPQGMKNSPAICQWYVAQALSPIRAQFSQVYWYHYMDDILVASPTPELLSTVFQTLQKALKLYRLCIAEEKVQQQPPWKYLGLKLLDQTIQPQAVQLNTQITMLNDLQKLLGAINWVRPYLGITTSQLLPLFTLLQGDPDLLSPRTLTEDAKLTLQTIEHAVNSKQVYRIDLQVPITLFVLLVEYHPVGIIRQLNDAWDDPLHVLEWVFLSAHPN